jgi:predicted nucleic acid-binding protein
MLVVSDATPLNVLIRAGHADLLVKLFGAVAIPPAVADELSRPATPETVRHWMAHHPSWLTIQSPRNLDPGIPRNRGEREAISLALELHADLLLVDDRRARMAAERSGLACAGTIGILEAAAAKGLIDLRQAFIALPLDFRDRLHPKLIEDALQRDGQRP